MSDGLTNGNIKAAALWRMVAGIFGACLLTMLAYFGNQLLRDVSRLEDSITTLTAQVHGLKADLARYSGEQASERARLDRANDRQEEIDRRLTILETRMAK